MNSCRESDASPHESSAPGTSSHLREPHAMLNILVIDDSAVVRQVMIAILGSTMHVTTASDATTAMAVIETLNPDVVVLDLEMRSLDALAFLRTLMEERPLPVVVCSSFIDSSIELTMRALQLGAVDVVLKLKERVGEQLGDSALAMVQTVRAASAARVGRPRWRAAVDEQPPRRSPGPAPATRVIAVGSSTGGTEPLEQILDAMTPDSPPMVIVHHMPERFTAAFARYLNETSSMVVREAVAGDILRPGLALISPGDRHMTLVRHGRRAIAVALHHGALVNRHRPSIDLLFSSAARMLGGAATGVLLSGMGPDGAQGLLEMKTAGALTIAQDEASSIVFGMAKDAIDIGAATSVLPADGIASALLHPRAG
jgi:two-component system chemotaxis response regulator CheB